MITNDVIKIANKAHLFNTLDFSKNISNLYIDQKQIVDKNYRTNSILVRIFDFENNQFSDICFPKGKDSSLFKDIKKYKEYSKKLNIFNVGIVASHSFYMKTFDLSSGKFLNKEKASYSSILGMLEHNCNITFQKINDQLEINKSIEELKKIQKQASILKKHYSDYKKNISKKKNDQSLHSKYKKCVENERTDSIIIIDDNYVQEALFDEYD